jgi:hypothetical protein
LLFEEEKRDANLFGLTVPIEILSQVQKKADVSKPGKSGKGARVEAVAFYCKRYLLVFPAEPIQFESVVDDPFHFLAGHGVHAEPSLCPSPKNLTFILADL